DPHAVLRLELTAITHVLQGRENTRDLELPDGSVIEQVAQFLAATDCLECTAPSRDVAATLEGASNRLIGGHIPIGSLITLLAATRDVLDICLVSHAEAAAPIHLIEEALVWATGPDVDCSEP